MPKSKGRSYRGFKIQKDSSDRYEVLAPSVDNPAELTVIADRMSEISEAMAWIDDTQFAKVFKPTAAEWSIIKEVALRGHDTQTKEITSISGVKLECRLHYNHDDVTAGREAPEQSINAMLVSHRPYDGCGDCDLADNGTHLTDAFRRGAPLNEKGDGQFDFYIYNRFDKYSDLAGNVLVEVRGGRMTRIWIEGGKDWSWTPESGISTARQTRPQPARST